MTMVSSGPISLAGTAMTGGLNQSIEKELGGNGSTQISFNDSAVRTLLGVSSGAIAMNVAYGKSNFTPHTDTHSSGSGNQTVPSGATSLTITRVGAGNDGGPGTLDIPSGDVRGGGGGGSGGISSQTIAIASGDWSTTIAYAVGSTPGASTSTTGSVAAGSVAGSVTGGNVGASGNSIGNTGGSGGSPGGNNGGAGGNNIGGTPGASPSGDGAGAGGGGGNSNGGGQGSGSNGEVKFAWS